PLIESTFMNHATAAPQPFSREQNPMLVGPAAPTRTPMPSLPLSPSTYGACSESSLIVTLSCLLVVSIPGESPVVTSTPLGLASRLSRFTLRSGGPANAPCTSAKVVFESSVTGRPYSRSVWSCADVSRRVTVSVILAESAPTSGLVVVSPAFRTRLAGRAVVTNTTRLSTTPGTSLAVMATAWKGSTYPRNVESRPMLAASTVSTTSILPLGQNVGHTPGAVARSTHPASTAASHATRCALIGRGSPSRTHRGAARRGSSGARSSGPRRS